MIGCFLVFPGFCVSRNAVTCALRCVLRTVLLDRFFVVLYSRFGTSPCHSEGGLDVKGRPCSHLSFVHECRTIGVFSPGCALAVCNCAGDSPLFLRSPFFVSGVSVLWCFVFYLSFTFERNKTVYLQRCL